MSGPVLGLLRALFVIVLTATLAVPAAGLLPVGDVPQEAADAASFDLAAPLREVEPEDLPAVARDLAEPFGTRLLGPDEIAGYDDLPDADKRVVWSVWLSQSMRDGVTGLQGSPLPAGQETPAAAQQEGAATEGDPLGKPRGLQGLWSIESHGYPREMHAAGDDGAHFLITSRGVLHFPNATSPPDWMVKPGGNVALSAVTDANGDGIMDIVLGLYSFWMRADPTLVVVDGAAGEVLYSGLSGDQALYGWFLDDLDGDGIGEIAGIDRQGRMVSYELDGTQRYMVQLTELGTLPSVGFGVVSLRPGYDPMQGLAPADVDGDGARDFVVSSSVWLSVSTTLGSVQPAVPLLSAYSSDDGALLWQTPTGRVHTLGGGAYPVDGGDFDGDGTGDILVVDYEYASVTAAEVVQIRYTIHSGNAGTRIAEDSTGYAMVCTIGCSMEMFGSDPIEAYGLLDLDADGAEEMVGFLEAEDSHTFTIVGRGMASEGDGMVELYRHDVSIDTKYDDFDGVLKITDVDVDGTPEMVFLLIAEAYDEAGETLEELSSFRFILDGGGVTGGKLDTLVAAWGVDSSGTEYGWNVRTDRWTTIDAKGNPTDDGFRLVTSSYPIHLMDSNRDSVPDLLMSKSIGYMWIDGRTGNLLEDIDRPLTTDSRGVHMEGSKARILESDWQANEYRLYDLRSFDEIWSLSRDRFEHGYLQGLYDMDGDSRLDALFRVYDLEEVTEEGPWGSWTYTTMTNERLVGIEPRANKTLFEISTDDGYAFASDVVQRRPGYEILYRHENDDGERVVDLLIPGETEAVWSYLVGDGHLYTAGAGYLLFRVEQEGEVFEIVDGSNGELVTSYPLPADGRATGTFFTPVNGDRFPDLVTTWAVELSETELEQEIFIYDWANEEEIARYGLQSGPPTIYTYTYGPNNEYSFTWVQHDYAYVSGIVDDLDGGGLMDFAYREAGHAVLRSTETGAVLALAPGKGSFIREHDMNGDGRPELLLRTDEGKLRFMAYSAKVTEIEDDEGNGVRTITDVDEAATEEAAKKFFGDVEDKGLPAPGAAIVVLLAVALLALRRRR